MKNSKPLFFTCRNCGKAKVLNPGDYCRDCAMHWELLSANYIIAKPDTLKEILEKTGWAREYVSERMEQSFEIYCSYIVFTVNGQWLDISVHDKFYIPRVMASVFERMADPDSCKCPVHDDTRVGAAHAGWCPKAK